MVDKYGTGNDPDCYPNSDVLVNLLNIKDASQLDDAERNITAFTAEEIDFEPPPYNLAYLQQIHATLFGDVYAWAGALRHIDISKGDTRFCTTTRIEPEANRLFEQAAKQNYFVDLDYESLIDALAEFYGDLNVVHPFREGNGRVQRILFEHIVVNCGWSISWGDIEEEEWIQASIQSYYADYSLMQAIFRRCIGEQI